MKDGQTGDTARQLARKAYQAARRTAENIGRPDNNLFIHGKAGLGKTFLTHCITKEALDRSFSALYFTSAEFFSLMEDAAFHRGDASLSAGLVSECDLLVIDDLGCELTNSFVNTQLFRCISDRITQERTTVISTNLTMGEIRDTYSDRVYSRIISHYAIVKLIGSDIRLQKKLSGGDP